MGAHLPPSPFVDVEKIAADPRPFKPDIPALFEQIRDEADMRAFDDPPPVFLRDGSPEYETLLREIDPTRRAIARRRQHGEGKWPRRIRRTASAQVTTRR